MERCPDCGSTNVNLASEQIPGCTTYLCFWCWASHSTTANG